MIKSPAYVRAQLNIPPHSICFTPFPDNAPTCLAMNFLSILTFYKGLKECSHPIENTLCPPILPYNLMKLVDCLSRKGRV